MFKLTPSVTLMMLLLHVGKHSTCTTFMAMQMELFQWLFHVIQQQRLNLQSTLVISTSVISDNRLSRCENLIPVLT